MNALITYHTVSGHTRRAAEDIAEGLAAEGATPRLVHVAELARLDAGEQEILIIGSPCHAGSLAIRSGVSGPVLGLLRGLAAGSLAGTVCGAFAVHCAYGGHRTVRAIERALRKAGASTPEPGVVVTAGVPFSVITGPMASEAVRQELREFGKALARAAAGDLPTEI